VEKKIMTLLDPDQDQIVGDFETVRARRHQAAKDLWRMRWLEYGSFAAIVIGLWQFSGWRPWGVFLGILGLYRAVAVKQGILAQELEFLEARVSGVLKERCNDGIQS
jgi:hypothetical protein